MQQSSMSAILLDVPLEGSNLCFACLYEHSQYFLLHYVCHMALCLSILWLTTLRKEESILLEIIEQFPCCSSLILLVFIIITCSLSICEEVVIINKIISHVVSLLFSSYIIILRFLHLQCQISIRG